MASPSLTDLPEQPSNPNKRMNKKATVLVIKYCPYDKAPANIGKIFKKENRMKKTTYLLITLMLTSIASNIFAEPLAIDASASKITWLGKKVTGQHNGTLGIKSGTIDITDNQINGGEFVFDMNDIKNEDIESEEFKNKLVGHLKSNDFFASSEFPEGKFVIKKVVPAAIPEDGNVQIHGELTLRGVTNPIAFPAKVTKDGSSYTAKAETVIDRTQWNLKYNSGKFFDPAKLGDKLIYNEITVGIEIATK